jgi:hypothetical protein
MKPLAAKQRVIFIDAEGKEHKGVITEVISVGSARIDITPRKADGTAADPENAPLGHHTALADYSEGKENGTFYFPADPATNTSAPAPDPLDHDGDGKKGGSLPRADRTPKP